MTSISEIKIKVQDESTHLIVNLAENPIASIILAHGAGAGMHHPFMKLLADSLAKQSINVIRFNFLYMDQKKRRPDSKNKTSRVFDAVYEWVLQEGLEQPLFAGGKSFGGRMATHWIHQDQMKKISGIVFYGFPLHSPAKPGIVRAEHLYEMAGIPLLFLQGKKDALARPELLNQVLAQLTNATVSWYDDANHSFKRPKRSGKTLEDTMEELVMDTVQWMKGLI